MKELIVIIEIWKSLKLSAIGDGYEISSLGRFRYNSQLLSEDAYYHSSNGYEYVMLDNHSLCHKVTLPIDDLIGLVFINKPKNFVLEKFHIEHINGDTRDSSLDNLRWVKNKEYWVDVVAPRRIKSGEIIDINPGEYKVSNMQQMYSNITHTFMKRHEEDGYIKYHLTYTLPDNSRKAFNVPLHRIMAESFKIPGKSNINNMVNHINGFKGECDLKNLEWVSNKENINHAFTVGLEKNPVGEDHPRSKFSNLQRECLHKIIETFKTVEPSVLLLFIKQRLPNTSLDDVKYAKQILKNKFHINFPILNRINPKRIDESFNKNRSWIQPIIDNIFEGYQIFIPQKYINKYKNKESV